MDGIKLLDQLKALRDEPDFRNKRTLSRQILESIAQFSQDLLRLLREEQDNGLKIEALNIIGSSQESSFAPAVHQVLNSAKSAEVRQTAATVLGKLRSETSLDTLVHFLKDENPNVRLGSIYGLIALGDKRAVRYLIDSLEDQEHVRSWWPSPKAGGYIVGREASIAIDALTGSPLRGDKTKIKQWISDNLI